MVTPARFRKLALGYDGALEVAHFDRAAFRTKRRIFATLPPDGFSANLLLDRDVQEAICEALPKAFSPVPGGWGRMGYTTVNLRTVTEKLLAVRERCRLARRGARRSAERCARRHRGAGEKLRRRSFSPSRRGVGSGAA